MAALIWFSFITSVVFFIPAFSASENYIVHMDLSAMPKAFSSHHSWYLSTVSSLSAESDQTRATVSDSKIIYSYSHVMNGFSAHLSTSELQALKKLPGYISSFKDVPVKLDTTRTPTFLGLDGAGGAWEPTNYGEGIIIGVIDTGIWPESLSYSDDGISEIPKKWKGECEPGIQFNTSQCNKKLIGARFFNKGLIAQNPNITFSMNSTRDTDGHGTHTSSTAAGNFVKNANFFGYAPGTAAGVAPKAHLAMYKALWDEGSLSSDIIAAIEQAIIDGVDVMSISLGLDGVPLYEDPIALATFAALDRNIFVATSAGNEGPFLGTLHNGIPWVLTVAAGTVDRDFQAVLTFSNGASIAGTSLYTGNYSSAKTPIVFLDSCLDTNQVGAASEKIVVCQNGKNASLSEQVHNLRIANVTGGVFITNYSDLELFIQSAFPAIFVVPKEGETIKKYIKSSNNPEASMEFQKTKLGVKSAPSLTIYSSRGPSPSCPYVMKPDIMGPGALILASWPKNVPALIVHSLKQYSDFNIISGTSMSCPHLAGVAALIKKAHPEWSPAAIRSAMMTTADTEDIGGEPIKDIGNENRPATPLDMGAGEVNPTKALDPGLIYDLNSTDYVRLLCGLNFTDKQIQTITGSASTDCSSRTLDLNYPSFVAFFNSNESKLGLPVVREFHRTVTNVGEGTSIYTANVTPMDGVNVSVIPGKLEFKGKYEKLSYKVVMQSGSKLKQDVIFGYLSWIDSKGKYTVKSPIVATSLSSQVVTT